MRKLITIAGLLAVLSPLATAQAVKSTAATNAPPLPPPPEHPITLEQTREIFALSGTRAMIRQAAHQALGIQKMNAPEYIPDDVWKDLENDFDAVDFAALLTPVYQKYLAQEDAEKVIEFYKTPAGQHFLSSMPMVMQSAGEVAKQEGARIGQEVFARHQGEIIAAKLKFDEQQKKQEEELSKPVPAGGKPEPVQPNTPHR